MADPDVPFTWRNLCEILGELRIIAVAIMALEMACSRSANDLLNDVIAGLWRQCQGDWQNKGYFFAAFRRAANRKVIDWARARKGRKNNEEAVGSEIDDIAVADTYTNSMSGVLYVAIGRLAEKPKTATWAKALSLYYFRGDEVADIAVAMKTTDRTVRRWIGEGEMALGVIIRGMEGSQITIGTSSKES